MVDLLHDGIIAAMFTLSLFCLSIPLTRNILHHFELIFNANNYHNTPPFHISQKTESDCGITCLRIVFEWCGVSSYHDDPIFLTSDPTWTIELLQCLLNHNVKAEMYTQCTGPLIHHDSIEWYSSRIQYDIPRIEYLFECAFTNKWPITKVPTLWLY
jgi:hypothetical protein